MTSTAFNSEKASQPGAGVGFALYAAKLLRYALLHDCDRVRVEGYCANPSLPELAPDDIEHNRPDS